MGKEKATGAARLRLVFMGTPDFSAEVLSRVLDYPGGEVICIYTQPDRPCGRGQKCAPPPVKKLAIERGIEVRQPENFKDPADIEALRVLNPDVLLVAAYGLILPKSVLTAAPHGAINVHTSLLPKYRGAAPIQRAILDGTPVTGVTIMQMEEGLDSGPILLQRALAIGHDDTALDLHDQLAEMGGQLLVETLDCLREGKLCAIPQDNDIATYAKKLSKTEGLIDFSKSALEVHNRIRAMYPWPGAYFFLERGGNKKPVRISLRPGLIGPELSGGEAPGSFLGLSEEGLGVACADRVYYLDSFHPQGKTSIDAKSFFCGYLAKDGDGACVASLEEPSA